MESGMKSIRELFCGNKYFSIPYYQRGYAWENKQIIDFYNDLRLTNKNTSYFFGTILLYSKEDIGIKESLDIVDGQQRITTLIIFIDCLIKRMKELNFKDKRYEELYNKFIRDDEGLYVLQIQDIDDDFFKTRILGDENSNDINTKAQRNLINAKKKFIELLSDCDVNEIENFEKTIYSIKLLAYLINTQAESAMIFETTNDRGKPLTNLEKTKSYLMYKASILNKYPDQIILMLQNRFNKIYSDYEELSGNFTDENSILQYSFIAYNSYDKKEYQHYMDVMKENVETFIFKNDVRTLNKYIEEYTLQIQKSFEIMKLIMNESFFEYNNLLYLDKMANFYPLLIKSYELDETNNKAKYKELCRLCEIFSFKVYSIKGLRSNTAQSKFFKLAKEFTGNFDLLYDNIKSIINEECTDEEFIKKILDENFYYNYGTVVRNYFYYRYESWLRENEQPKVPPMAYEELIQKQNKKYKLSIEHIVAQNNNDEKSKIVKDYLNVDLGDAEYFDKKYLHCIGNLTIDPQSANSSKGKKDVEEKMSKYFIRAPYKCQNELDNYLVGENKNIWNITSIKKRTEKLLKFAKETWCNI